MVRNEPVQLILRAEKRCARQLDQLTRCDRGLHAFLARLVEGRTAVVFGGFVRDALHSVVHDDPTSHRDLDVVVCGSVPRGDRHNDFGGWRRLSKSVTVDYWSLAKTYAFRVGILKPTLPNLLGSTVFDINACYFQMHVNQIRQRGALAAIKARTIGFNCRGYVDRWRELSCYRAMDYADRLDYRLDEEVQTFVVRTLGSMSPAEFGRRVKAIRSSAGVSRVIRLARKWR